jgi:hypothetical protein
MVLINLTLAVICFGSNMECHPILYGEQTPKGEFTMVVRVTPQVGYGGDVIQFHSDGNQIYAIHRLWTRSPQQQREQRISSPDISRRKISAGCINVMPEVYEQLKACCVNEPLKVIQ